jgi:hypothetical protein
MADKHDKMAPPVLTGSRQTEETRHIPRCVSDVSQLTGFLLTLLFRPEDGSHVPLKRRLTSIGLHGITHPRCLRPIKSSSLFTFPRIRSTLSNS